MKPLLASLPGGVRFARLWLLALGTAWAAAGPAFVAHAPAQEERSREIVEFPVDRVAPHPPTTAIDEWSLEDLLPLALVLLAIFPVLYVSAIAHELGHALLARWSGYL